MLTVKCNPIHPVDTLKGSIFTEYFGFRSFHRLSGTETPAFKPGRKCRSFAGGLSISGVGVEYLAAVAWHENDAGGCAKFDVSASFKALRTRPKRNSFALCCWSIDTASNRSRVC